MKYIATVCAVVWSVGSFASELSPNSDDCQLMRGVSVTVHALNMNPTGYGNIDYWIRTFEIRRDTANAIAAGIRHSAVPATPTGLLRTALEELARDINAAQQTGYGDLYYWISAVNQSASVYRRASQKILTLTQSVCAGL